MSENVQIVSTTETQVGKVIEFPVPYRPITEVKRAA